MRRLEALADSRRKMKKIFTDENLALVWCVRNELENAGVESDVRNYMLGGAAGDIPVTECWPEIWVHEQDTPRAKDIVAEAVKRRLGPGTGWQCDSCGEWHGGQFGTCWNCGAARAS